MLGVARPTGGKPTTAEGPAPTPASLHGLVGLARLMDATEGSPAVSVAVIDGAVDLGHPALAGSRIRLLDKAACCPPDDPAFRHGTFITGLLAADRNSAAPGICPGCPLLLRPVFMAREANFDASGAAPDELAEAILEAIDAGARVINLSLALLDPGASSIKAALDHAMRRGVLIAAASGNQGTVGSTPITRHPWVIPVAACDSAGQPLALSNLSASAGRNGVLAPGDRITGLKAGGGFETASGTSVAVPFVSGSLALLASLFPLCAWGGASSGNRLGGHSTPFCCASPSRCRSRVAGPSIRTEIMDESETVTKDKRVERHQPYQVRLPGFVADRPVGLGDAVSGVTEAFGFRPCGGCARRGDALNRWVVLTR